MTLKLSLVSGAPEVADSPCVIVGVYTTGVLSDAATAIGCEMPSLSPAIGTISAFRLTLRIRDTWLDASSARRADTSFWRSSAR